MIEIDRPGNGVEMKAWYDAGIGRVRVTSSPGGVALTPDEAREVAEELAGLADEAGP